MTEASGILGGLGNILSGLLGEGSIAQQFLVWGELSSVVSALNGPFLQALANDLNAKNPETPISPADLADMVVRGILAQADAAPTAAKSGVSAEDFDLLIRNTGEPPAIEQMLQLMRRDEATQDDVIKAIRQSRVRDEWVPFLLKLGVQPPTPTDVIDAAVKDQIDDAGARALYQQLGGDPQYYDLMYNTAGSSPSPDQAATMARRGIIPRTGTGPGVVSYDQAVREGHWKNKWGDAFWQASQYYPPPRTIVTLVHQGVISDARAAELLAQQGVPEDLIAGYLAEGHATKTATVHQLAAGTIEQLYADKAITKDEATALLVKLNYTAEDAGWLLELQDVKREQHYQNLAINKIHNLYVGHKAAKSDAGSALRALGVPQDQVDHLFTVWDLEREANIAHLSPAQIVSGFKYGIFDQAAAMSLLQEHGYLPHDAWAVLSIGVHSAQPNEPPPDVPPLAGG